MTTNLLFVCTAMGVRAIFAAGFANKLAAGKVLALPSGFEDGRLAPRIRQLLAETGIETSAHSPPTVFDRHRNKECFDYVITLCNNEDFAQCPIFQQAVDTIYGKKAKRINWNIRDFRSIEASGDEWKYAANQIVSDIKIQVQEFLA